MISCKRATELMSKSMEDSLTLTEEISLRIHNFICEYCEQFKKQLVTIRKVLHHGLEHETTDKSGSQPKLSQSAKDKIKSSLKE